MDVDVARPPKAGIFEMMRLQIGDGVAHIVLARQERLVEDNLVAAANPRASGDGAGQGAGAQLGPERTLSELGMGEPEIVELLGDMVGKFIAQRKTQPVRRPVRPDQVEADNFRLFAAVLGEGGGGKGGFRRHHAAAVALVEPFRLRALLARRRFAGLQPQFEHLHGVGELGAVGKVFVHAVASFRRTQMGQTGAGDDQVRRVLGMVQRRQDTALGQGGANIDRLAKTQPVGQRLQGQFFSNGAVCQLVGCGRALDDLAPGVIAHHGYGPASILCQKLHQPHPELPLEIP